MAKAVRVTINEKATEAQPTDTVLAVAKRLGIEIPTLCYMDGKKPSESCGLCMVQVEGVEGHVPACAKRVHDGMVVHTETEALRKVRKVALELLLSDHLGDCLAPCQLGCPAHIDIPRFVGLVRKGQPREALAAIKESVAFPGVLGRICPRPCESACRRKDLDEPISILSLKRFAADSDAGSDTPYLPQRKPSTGKRVAIVGGGIAGLTAAYYLLLEGHECAIFDAGPALGGALRLIPEFRLPRKTVDAEIAVIERLGVRFYGDNVLGRDLALDEMRKRYGAILLAIGRTRESPLDIPGGDLAIPSVKLLRQAGEGTGPRSGDTALVAGSGPGALDICRGLVRLGCKGIRLVPGRPIESSPLFRHQAEDARREGVEILPPAAPLRIERVDASGFRTVFHRDQQEFSLEAQRVFHAGEMEPDLDLLRALGLETTARGLCVDHRTLMTNLPGVFAAGAMAGGGRYAVHASASGRHAAVAIGHYLRGEMLEERKPLHVSMHHLSEKEHETLFRGLEKTPRRVTEGLGPDEARASFAEVDRGFRPEAAAQEAGRCLRCACAKKDDCRLRALATEYEADPHRYGGERQPFERETTHEDVVFEPAKCIKCGRCILIAEEAREPLGLTYIGRGFRVKVGVPFGEALKAGLRTVGLRCAAACPTGALAAKEDLR